MKKVLLTLFIGLFIIGNTKAQEEPQSENTLQGVITTGVPFLLIAADARSAGLADMGVATGADAFSQQWNPAKYAFAIDKQGVGLTYTPYLSQLVNDIDLGNVVYYNRINEQSAVAGSIRYFSTGEIELRDTPDQQPNIVNPNEFAIDLSYSLRLSERFAMAVAGRFINSDLKIPTGNGDDVGAASTFAVDVAGYYQSEEIAYADFYGRWRLGFNISNIGPKLKYDEAGQENNLPTNLG
ncbi:MAG: type IX secretion system outer membrane channel protein PorV, partial [Flavobacteriaceae bacterium]|nr:type IX secretion system outer membrane channel protein PorV [Flavobacteriaceae bacterium]